MKTLLQNANTAYNTQIKQITYVTLFADFPSQQNQIPNTVAQGQIARHARIEDRAGNLFYLRAVSIQAWLRRHKGQFANNMTVSIHHQTARNANGKSINSLDNWNSKYFVALIIGRSFKLLPDINFNL